MLEEFNERQVNTPRVRSRAEAWLAWEAAMKAKYSKIRKKIEAGKNKELQEFQSWIDGDYYKFWMFVHNTRPRRKELLLENLDGSMEWFKLDDIKGRSPSFWWRIHPDYEFYRNRQDYVLELQRNAEENRTFYIDEFVFREDFHDHELTPEELEKRREEEEAQWLKMQAAQAERALRLRMEELARQQERELLYRENQLSKMNALYSAWMDLDRPIVRHEVQQGGAIFRVFYLIEGYHEIDELILDILANTLTRAGTGLNLEFSAVLVLRLLGYPSVDAAKERMVSGMIPNLKKLGENNA